MSFQNLISRVYIAPQNLSKSVCDHENMACFRDEKKSLGLDFEWKSATASVVTS